MSDLERQVPGKVQAIGIMHLVGGIMNIILALVWALNGVLGVTYIVGVAFCCPALLLLPIGIVEIISGAKHLSKDHTGLAPPKTTAIAEIVSILGCSMFPMVFGILTLVFLSDPEVEEYYARNQLTGY